MGILMNRHSRGAEVTQSSPRVPGRLSAVVLLAAVVAPLAAQAPRITPSGDPSVKSDTIYALAVDPSQYPDDPFIYLLDDGVLRYEADGRGSRTYRQVVQILNTDGVETWAEQSFGYEPGHQKLTINWVRVVRPDGSIVSEAPTLVQDADIPATMGNPVYTDQKVKRMSLSGVAPGTIVDFSYTLEEQKPYLPGDFYRSWSVHTTRMVRRSRYLVDLPASLTPNIVERNLLVPRKSTTAGGRRTYLWTAQDVATVKAEEFASDSNGITSSIEVGGAIRWSDIGKWYAGLAKGREVLTPDLATEMRQIVAGATSADDSLRAIHRWVAQDFRYVSVSLGVGGYQPRTPAEVRAAGYGDCKDKATMFVALARALGFTAYPVLLNAGAEVETRIPAIEQFNHAIAVVERPVGRVYVDLTSDVTPYGELPPSDQGQFALVVRPDGATEEVRLPQDPASANRSETRISGELGVDGLATVTYVERATGTRQYGLRGMFTTPLDSARKAAFARNIATGMFPGASADSLQVFDGRDLKATPEVSLRISRGQAARKSGGTMILNIPFNNMGPLADAATALEAKGPRRFPLDAARVIGPITGLSQLTLTLPPGWQARLPDPVTVSGIWGTYTASFTQTGRILTVTRSLEGTRGIYPPSEVTSLAAWLRAVAADDAPYVVLETGAKP
jgi:hypothetical protein